MLSNVLIIDKRKELSIKYKKSIEDTETSAVISRDLKDALHYIQHAEPDIIIISDSLEENLSDLCRKIRALTYNTRPVIVALSKSADTSDRIEVLENGADDFLSEPVNIDEFKMRIRAHLRRDIESNLDSKTLLPNKKFVEKNLKRLLNNDNKPAVLLLGLENLKNYKSVYTDVAGDKLIQTLVAIIKSTLDNNDFLGQLDDENFVIITSPYTAEKMAVFLTFAFDTVAPKFYSAQDAKRGYMLLKGDRMAGMRANFVSLLIGGIIDNYEQIKTVEALEQRLFSIKKIAKIPSGSNYTIDRIKLAGENSVVEPKVNNFVFIKEPDEALALLLRTTLELQGYDVTENLNMNSVEQPAVLIIDSNDDLSGLDFCREIKSKPNFVNTKIIITTTVHNKTAILDAGADLYLPKPYEISDLIRWIEFFRG